MKIRITLVALFLCLLPAAAQADPLVITGGQFVATGQSSVGIQVFGENFSYSAGVPHGSVLPFASSPFPAGTTRSLGGTQGFFSGSASLCFSGTCFFQQGSAGPEFVGGSVTFSAGSFTFPQFGPDPPATLTFTVPFTMTGTINASRPINSESASLLVVGQGEMTFTYSTFVLGGGTHYVFRSAVGTFNTPTPEPATLLLLTTGLAGAGAAARRRRRT